MYVPLLVNSNRKEISMKTKYKFIYFEDSKSDLVKRFGAGKLVYFCKNINTDFVLGFMIYDTT